MPHKTAHDRHNELAVIYAKITDLCAEMEEFRGVVLSESEGSLVSASSYSDTYDGKNLLRMGESVGVAVAHMWKALRAL